MASDFKVSNLVMVAKLNCEISSLSQLYDCLVIHKVDFTIGTKLRGIGRETVPFFGINNILIGLKYEKLYRGIYRPKGHLPNLVGIDIQTFDKNHNLKLGNNKILLTGGKSEESSIKTFQIMIDHIKMTDYNLKTLMGLSMERKQTLRDWIFSNYLCCEIDDKGVKHIHLKSFKDCFELACNSEFKDEELRSLKYLTMFVVEYKDYMEYAEKIDRIMSYIYPLLFEDLRIETTKVCNGVYTFNLGVGFSLLKICQYLSTIKRDDGMPRYGVSFHNWSSKMQTSIICPINPEDVQSPYSGEGGTEGSSDDEEKPKNKKLEAHRFTVSQKGSVKQYSPTPSVIADLQHQQFVKDLEGFINPLKMAAALKVMTTKYAISSSTNLSSPESKDDPNVNKVDDPKGSKVEKSDDSQEEDCLPTFDSEGEGDYEDDDDDE